MADRSQPLSLVLVSPEDVAQDETVFDGAPETDAWLELEVEDELVDLADNHPCQHFRLIMAVRVYRSAIDLEYQLSLSYGLLAAEPEIVEEEEAESIFVNLDNSVDLSRKAAAEVLSASWEGEVRDSAGNIVPNPPSYYADQQDTSRPGPLSMPAAAQVSGMSFAGGVLSWGPKLHGTLRVRYRSVYERWLVTIEARAGENPYQPESYLSHISAFYEGRAEDEDLDPDFDCGGSGSDNDDEEDEPDEQCVDHIIEVYGCNGEPTGNEWDEVGPCPDADAESEETA